MISAETKNSVFPWLPLSASRVVLKTYTGEAMSVLGEIPNLIEQYRDQVCERVIPHSSEGTWT